MKKSFIVLLALLLVCSIPSVALETDFSGGVGAIESSGETVMNAFLRSDLKQAPWGLGLDLNFPMPEDKKPADLDMFVLRYAEYDDGTWGLRLGTLEDLTYGYGMVMDNYSTVVQGSTVITNEHMGARFYTRAFPLGIHAFAARNGIFGVRLTEDFWPDLVFGKPLILGQTLVSDPDGVNVDGTIVGKGQSAIGIDAGVPLIPGSWDLYAEYGMLPDADSADNIDAVSGMALGTKFMVTQAIQFDFRYLTYGQGYVPGYFNSQYESSPVDLTSSENVNTESKSGWQGTLVASLSEMITFSGTYQSFEGHDPSLSAEASANLPQGIQAAATYSQPRFASLSDLDSNNATIEVDVYYPLNGPQVLIVHYKRVALGGGVAETSTSFEYSIDLNDIGSLF
ncbi:hypothetical protein ACFL57_00185 [Candidatus Margulisiibacteriota bacterium]